LRVNRALWSLGDLVYECRDPLNRLCVSQERRVPLAGNQMKLGGGMAT
jgi:hypothetical protein